MRKVLVIIAGLIILMACSKKERLKEEAAPPPPPPVNDLPAMEVTLLDGSKINAKEIKGKAILILFQPDCDHCQHEAEQIQQNLESFKNYTLYFISSATQPEIRKFAADYKLANQPRVLFGMATTESVINSFGPIQAPSIYIYSDQKLVKDFNGQVDVGMIIQYL